MEFGPTTFPAYEGATAAARAHALVLVACGSEEVETTELLRAVREDRCRRSRVRDAGR
jgi:hypothetical protein